MDFLGISDETESLLSTIKLYKKLKLPRKLLDDNDAVNHASVPRKLRSAMKRRGHESVNPSLSISSRHNRVCNEVGTRRKNGVKKSKLNMKPGKITKDEKEVAETLFALAGMFSDAAKIDKPGLDWKPKVTKSSTALETGSIMTATEDTGILTPGGDSTKTGTKVTLEATSLSSNMLDSSQVVKFRSLDDSKHLEFLFNKQSPISVSFGVQSDSSNGVRSKMSERRSIPNEQAIALEHQVVASGIHYFPKEDKNNGLFPWPNLSLAVAQSSDTREPFPRSSFNKLPAWFENTKYATQPCITAESVAKKKLCEVYPKKSWKKCSAHVHISRLIKVLQTKDRNQQLLESSTQINIGRHVELVHQKMRSVLSSDVNALPYAAGNNIAEIGHDTHVNESHLQKQHGGSKSSPSSSSFKQGSDFLSLASGGSGLDACSGEEHGNEAVKQYHFSQNHSAMFYLQPQNSCSSLHGRPLALIAQQQQTQLPPFLSSALGNRVTTPTGHRWESLQPKWTAPSSVQQCNTRSFSPIFTNATTPWGNGIIFPD